MSTPASLPEALRGHAEARPFEPWLFYPSAKGWQWVSFEGAWRLLERSTGQVAAPPSDEKILPALDPHVESAVLDLRSNDQLENAAALEDRLTAVRRRTPHRDVTVLAHPLETPLSRLHLAWATLTAAALLVEPNPAAHLATATWARPTVLVLASVEEADLFLARAEKSRSTPRSPFGRLRALVVPSSLGLREEDQAFWQGRRVQILNVDL